MSTRYRTSKKVTALILIMIMVIGSMPGLFTAGEGKVFAAIFNGGNGSVDNPYLLSSPFDLDYIRNFPDKHYKLLNDIDLTEYLSETGAGYNNGAFWKPISNFSGSFDGDGYVIRGLKINRNWNFVGFFSDTVQDAFITNIGLEDVEITGGDMFVGAMVGMVAGGSLSNSYTTGNVSGTYYVGGLVGYQLSGSILNSFSSVHVSGAYIGGLVSLQDGGSLWNSYAAGLLTPSGGWVGGLVGGGTDFKGRYDWEVNGYNTQWDPGAKTTLEMQQQATFEGWDFNDVWVMLPNQYPQLRVFVAAKTPVAFPDPTAGHVEIGSTVILTSRTEGSSIYFTTNGDDPTENSELYDESSLIEVIDDVTIKAIAVYPGKIDSSIMSKSYKIIRPDAPSTGTLEKGTLVGTTKLNQVTALMEYKVNDGEFLRINGTFVDDIIVAAGDIIYVRFVAEPPNAASHSQELIVAKTDIHQSTDATLTSTIGLVSEGNTTAETITAIPYGTTLTALKAAISPAAAATYEVYQADGVTVATALATGNKIIVTAHDGVTKVTYTVTVLKNTEATLTSTIGVVSVTGTETETITSIPYGTTLAALKAAISPAAAATYEVYQADGVTVATALATGNKIIVTAHDGVTKVTYTVTVLKNTEATLTSTIGVVSVTGTETETITSIPYGTTLAALKAAISPAAAATYEVYQADGVTVATALATGNKIIVTAHDGVTKVTYTVTVLKNTEATLTSTIGVVSVTGTETETITSIPYGTTLTVLKAAIMPAAAATYEVYQADGVTVATTLATGNKIIVTAHDGVTKVTYTVTVLKNTEATLTSTIGVVSATGTGTETITSIPYGTSLVALKAAITPASDATYEVYLADGVTVATALATGNKIIVTAEDRVTQVIYTVTVLKNTEATLTTTIGVVSATGTGTETITSIPYGTTLAALKAAITPASDATYEVYQADGVTVATTLATGNKIIVTAHDGVTKVTYTVTVLKNKEATLTSTIGVVSATGTGTETITIIPYGTTLASLKAAITPASDATYEVYLADGVTVATTLATGNKIIVTAHDGVTKVTYTVTVLKNKEATLTSTIGVVSATGTGTETITSIPYGTTLAALKAAITPASDATYEVYLADGVTVATTLSTGNKVIVTAHDGVTKVMYTVTVLKNKEATLTSTIGVVSATGTGTETITSIPYGTTLAALKAAITPASDATYEVYLADGVTVATTLSTGNKVIVTAEDGVTKVTYTVTVNEATAPPIGEGNTGSAPTPGKVTSKDGIITIPTGSIGEVSLESGITIFVPAGAVDRELKVTITKLLDTRNDLINKEALASSIYEVLKNYPGNFMKPVTLTFTFDANNMKSGQGIAVFYYDEVNKVWVEVKGGKTKGNQISVEIYHFTKFAVLVIDNATGLPVTEVTTPVGPEIILSDITGHWAEASIKQALKAGFVNGYVDGTFKPGKTITRAEFTVMLMKATKPQEAGKERTFIDNVDIGTWAQAAIAQAVQAGIINGYADGTFRPNANITRAEMSAMIAKALQLPLNTTAVTSFADDQTIPVWAKGAVAALKERGIVNGTGANRFNPLAQTTRAEAVVTILNMLKQAE